MARIADCRQSENADTSGRAGQRQHELSMTSKWSLGSEVKHTALPGGAMLYDGSRLNNLNAAWFDPQHWAARGEIEGTARGRGSVQYIHTDGRKFVLRHYLRGGLVASLS